MRSVGADSDTGMLNRFGMGFGTAPPSGISPAPADVTDGTPNVHVLACVLYTDSCTSPPGSSSQSKMHGSGVADTATRSAHGAIGLPSRYTVMLSGSVPSGISDVSTRNCNTIGALGEAGGAVTTTC